MPQHRTQAYLALAAICIIWGTTYTAIKYAVHNFPPLLLVGIRQTAAGFLLLIWVWLSERLLTKQAPSDVFIDYQPQTSPLNGKYLARQALIGICTITGGNGFITWAMQHVPSGLAAVIGSLTPVVVVLINLGWKGSERINSLIIAGVLLGFGGLGMIFRDGWAYFLNPSYAWGIAFCFFSCFSWSLGTVMAKRWNDPHLSPALNAGIQITAGGVGGFLLSIFLDKSHQIHHTPESWAAVLYLIVFGSAIAFTLYMFTLRHLSATVSSLYTYVNPLVALLLGWVVLDEQLNTWEIGGMAVTIGGVWLVNRGYQVANKEKVEYV